MCYSGCPYENFNGACKGRPRGPITARPHCFEPEDVESYNESVEAERRRIAEEKAKAEAEEAARQADDAHKFRIHGEILEDLKSAGSDTGMAMQILDAIRDGEVRNLKIIY